MKTSFYVVALAALVGAASLTQAHAQNKVSTFDVPFAFAFSGEHLSAGTYTITIRGGDFLALSNHAKSDTHLAMIQSSTDLRSANAQAGLTFWKYGDTYLLAAYSTKGTKLMLIAKKKERSLAREFAANQTEPVPTQLAAREK
jgi:hypothetical protein